MPDFSTFEVFLKNYFPEELSDRQMEQFSTAFRLYPEWNTQINLVSRKDLENLAERHFLHSLSIARVIRFAPGTSVLDVGTGGGFPGIPLAIFFPQVQFHLVDSIAKKMKVVEDVVQKCGLENVRWSVQRAESLTGKYDFVVSRAVAPLAELSRWVRSRVHCDSKNTLPNGLICLKGGDLRDEIREAGYLPGKPKVFPIRDFFPSEFFDTKSVVYLPWCREKIV